MARKSQLWVHYNQVTGSWDWRISTPGVTAWSRSGLDYRTEFEALNAAHDAWPRYSEDEPPEPVVFRTSRDFAAASLRASRGRSVR